MTVENGLSPHFMVGRQEGKERNRKHLCLCLCKDLSQNVNPYYLATYNKNALDGEDMGIEPTQ